MAVNFNWLDDETCEIDVNKTHVYTMSHGPHGWDGMEGIRDALYSLCDILDIPVNVYGDEGI